MSNKACHDVVNLQGSFKSERIIAFSVGETPEPDNPDDTSSHKGSQLSANEAINRMTAVAFSSLRRFRYVLILHTCVRADEND